MEESRELTEVLRRVAVFSREQLIDAVLMLERQLEGSAKEQLLNIVADVGSNSKNSMNRALKGTDSNGETSKVTPKGPKSKMDRHKKDFDTAK